MAECQLCHTDKNAALFSLPGKASIRSVVTVVSTAAEDSGRSNCISPGDEPPLSSSDARSTLLHTSRL